MAAQKKSFEALYGELEDTTRRLEEGNLPLDESIKLYEQGAKLVEELRTILDEAELHVKTLQVRLQPPEAAIEFDDMAEVEGEFDSTAGSTDVAGGPDSQFDDDIEAYDYEDEAPDD
ncbi:MAG TPA: exodeoxyribonuclease VII small subunit [Tepidiformaceae bacterium]|nr:exodeoxyribonuclease VII small subunit [Tepidiformaceae bacterium]